MEFLQSVAVMGLAAMAILATSAIVVGLWRSGADDARPVLLEEMLRRQGEDVARLALAPEARSFAAAVGRCLDCSETAKCRAWLDSGAERGYEAFCPNADYVTQLRSLTASARRPQWA